MVDLPFQYITGAPKLNTKEFEDLRALKTAKSELANTAFLAESLLNEGYEIIPIISFEYSKTLKDNLKVAHAPALLYIKGNKQIMREKSIAIVGSRVTSGISLQFTDNIAKLASKNYKVVESGFARGVDKQALDSAINFLLIQKGAIPIDFNGKTTEGYVPVENKDLFSAVNEPTADYEKNIIDLLKNGEYMVKDIMKKFNLNISEKKLKDFLKSHKEVEALNKKPLLFTMKSNIQNQKKLFD